VKLRIILFIAAAISASVHAAPATPAVPNPADAMVILNNIATHFPVLFDLITIIAASIGLSLHGYRALWSLSNFSTTRAVDWASTHNLGRSGHSCCWQYFDGSAVYASSDRQCHLWRNRSCNRQCLRFQTTGMSADQLTVYTSLMNFFAICGYAFFIQRMDGYQSTLRKWIDVILEWILATYLAERR
jgi:hypothetical protein